MYSLGFCCFSLTDFATSAASAPWCMNGKSVGNQKLVMLTGRWLLWGVWRRADPVQRDAFSLYLLWMLQAITVLAVWAHEQDQKVAFFRALALCGSLEVGSKTYFWGVVYCTWVTSYIRNPLCPDLVYVKGLVVKVIFLASNCVENYHWSNFLLVLLIIGTAALI